MEIEGARKNCDVTRWGQFTYIKDIKGEMLKRLDVHFEKWLNSHEARADSRRAGKSSVSLSLGTESEQPACIFLSLSAV